MARSVAVRFTPSRFSRDLPAVGVFFWFGIADEFALSASTREAPRITVRMRGRRSRGSREFAFLAPTCTRARPGEHDRNRERCAHTHTHTMTPHKLTTHNRADRREQLNGSSAAHVRDSAVHESDIRYIAPRQLSVLLARATYRRTNKRLRHPVVRRQHRADLSMPERIEYIKVKSVLKVHLLEFIPTRVLPTLVPPILGQYPNLGPIDIFLEAWPVQK